MKIEIDAVVGLQYGDESKGKITLKLLQSGKYSHTLRFNGGHNAGHTVYLDGKKLITHIIPTGALLGIKSIIGPGCVVSPELLDEELRGLLAQGVDVSSFVHIANNAHVITTAHLDEDGKDTKIGTTRRGNGPAYRDKYNRTGMLAKDHWAGHSILIDIYEEFYEPRGNAFILAEGAQGFFLDIVHGNYPYVTSSHVTTAGIGINGFPPNAIRTVWGAAKCYETYVGSKRFQPDGDIYKQIAHLGQEYGATTGRPRQVNFLNTVNLIRSIRMNGANEVVISKMDILDELKCWKTTTQEFSSRKEFERSISIYLGQMCPSLTGVWFSDSKTELGNRKMIRVDPK
jgi:adenylosuccinate synthase